MQQQKLCAKAISAAHGGQRLKRFFLSAFKSFTQHCLHCFILHFKTILTNKSYYSPGSDQTKLLRNEFSPIDIFFLLAPPYFVSVFVSLSDFLSVYLVGFLYPCRTPCSQCFTADYSHQGTHFHSHNAISTVLPIHPHDLRITKFHFGFVTLGKSILDMCHP